MKYKIFFLILATSSAVYLFYPKDTASNRWLDSRYDQEVKLFLTENDEQALKSLANDSNLVPELQKIITILSKKPFEKYNKVPEKTSCAVVGNAPNLIQSNYGPIIDAHTYVFRMNNAPVEGYQTDVGSRTTFHVLHNWLPEIRNYGPETTTILGIFAFYINPAEAEANLKFITAKFKNQDTTEIIKVGKVPKNITEFVDSLLIVHPDFLNYQMTNWYLPQRGNLYKSREEVMPSTGFSTIILAMHMCDSIDLFGFGRPDSQGIWQHYFEKRIYTVPAKHKADFQWKFLQEMKEKNIVKIFPGKEEGSTL